MQSLLKIGIGANALAHFMAMMKYDEIHKMRRGKAVKRRGLGARASEKMEKCVVSKVYFSHIFLQIACDFYLFARRHLILFSFLCQRRLVSGFFFLEGILNV